MTDKVNEAVQYRKKPAVIEAVQWDGRRLSHVPGWLSKAINTHPGEIGGVFRVGEQIHVFTLEGTMIATPGDWIIRGVKGELYPCKPDIFAATYEPAAHPSRGVVDDWTAADNGDYDRSIHANPSAEAWADFFVATFPGLAGKHDLMRGWFANAMMAMHDHLHHKAQAAALPAVPEVCVWTFDDDAHAPMWTSPCGVTYSFTEGGPEDNGHKFCHSCGKPLVLAATPAHDQPEGSDND